MTIVILVEWKESCGRLIHSTIDVKVVLVAAGAHSRRGACVHWPSEDAAQALGLPMGALQPQKHGHLVSLASSLTGHTNLTDINCNSCLKIPILNQLE